MAVVMNSVPSERMVLKGRGWLPCLSSPKCSMPLPKHCAQLCVWSSPGFLLPAPSVAATLAVTLRVALSGQCQCPRAAVTGLGASTQQPGSWSGVSDLVLRCPLLLDLVQSRDKNVLAPS
ncbi:hypothetical protein GH733_015466 [Mirounga leonina]|nr:hypothetical protein GH733_015466 [Mirounga leonina]